MQVTKSLALGFSIGCCLWSAAAMTLPGIEQPIADVMSNLKKVDSCSTMYNKPGYYVITGTSKLAWYVPACMLHLLSPPGTKIEIELVTGEFNCGTSEIMLLDGWYLVDRVTHQIGSVPHDLTRNSSRTHNICDDSGKLLMKSSQNYAEVMHDLRPPQWIAIKVDFVQQHQQDCNTLLYEAVGQHTMSNHGRAGVCRWYVSGSVMLHVLDTNLDSYSQNCLKSGNRFTVMSDAFTWQPGQNGFKMTACDAENAEPMISPCRFTTLALQTTTNETKWIKFTLRPLQDDEKEPWLYFCT